jgi:hypothetical protein
LLRLTPKLYATTRAILRALLIARQIYGVDYDGFYDSLNQLFRRPETEAHFAQFRDLYRRRRTSQEGKWLAANIKYIARNVIYKYQLRYKGGSWPPVAPGEARGRWRYINPPELSAENIALEGDSTTGSKASSSVTELAVPKLVKLIVVDPETAVKINPNKKDSWRYVYTVNNRFHVITVTSLTFLHLVASIKPQLPDSRTVQTVYGCMITPTATDEPGDNPEHLMPLNSDATVQGFLLAASILPLRLLVILRRPPPAADDVPRPATPPPVYHELDDDLFVDEEEPIVWLHSDSDDDEDTVRKRFTPPRTKLGFLKAMDKVGRSTNRQVLLSKRIQNAAEKKRMEDRLCFPHERCYRRNMGLADHKRLKRKYDALGRVESNIDLFSICRSENPIEGIDIDEDGNLLDEDGQVVPDPDESPDPSDDSDSDDDDDEA